MISLIATTYRSMRRRMPARHAAITFCLFLGLVGTGANAAAVPWRSLPSAQQEALAPLAQEWDRLPEAEQRRWLRTAKRYPQLTLEQKQRFSQRLAAWSKLTPEQRKAAREKYRAFRQVPAEKREQVKQMIQQDQANKTTQADSNAPETPQTKKP